MDFSPLVSESHPRRVSGGIRRLVVRKIHLTWKTIHNAYPVPDKTLYVPGKTLYVPDKTQ